jgi:hypothetical protein
MTANSPSYITNATYFASGLLCYYFDRVTRLQKPVFLRAMKVSYVYLSLLGLLVYGRDHGIDWPTRMRGYLVLHELRL